MALLSAEKVACEFESTPSDGERLQDDETVGLCILLLPGPDGLRNYSWQREQSPLRARMPS